VVGMVVLHSCIRTHKMAWALRLKGYDVHLFTERVVGGHGFKDYSACHILSSGFFEYAQIDEAHVVDTIKATDKLIDVWHVHNEPDFPVELVRRGTDKPIVYDIHDMVSMRQKKPFPDEEKALDSCSAVCVPSGDYKSNIVSRTGKPCIEILSCVPEILMPRARTTLQFNGIVYEGGLKGKKNDKSEQFQWRNWASVFSEITKMGIPVYVYPNTSGEDLSEYAESGVINMGTHEYTGLLRNLTAFEASIIGSPYPDNPAFDGALPNKLFESIAAGVPMVVLNAPTLARFVESLGFGTGVETVEQIPQALEDIKINQLREYMWTMRKYWTMDKQIHKLESLYESLCSK